MMTSEVVMMMTTTFSPNLHSSEVKFHSNIPMFHPMPNFLHKDDFIGISKCQNEPNCCEILAVGQNLKRQRILWKLCGCDVVRTIGATAAQFPRGGLAMKGNKYLNRASFWILKGQKLPK